MQGYIYTPGFYHISQPTNITVFGNNVSNNPFGITLFSSSDNDLTGNTANSNRVNGFSFIYANNNNLTANNASNNSHGFYFVGSPNNVIKGNKASNNSYGISIFWISYENDLSGNAALNNEVGIYTSSLIPITEITEPHIIPTGKNKIDCRACHNIPQGPYYNNTLAGNTVSLNKIYGIFLNHSAANTIYNNIFNNTNNSGFNGTGNNIWNTTKKVSTNIIGGINLGGNVWAHPNGTGFSHTCADNDNDGICDSSYNIFGGNVDHLPLKYRIPPPAVTIHSVIDGNGRTVPNNGVTTSNFITFIFNDSTDASGFECSLDGAVFISCANPKSYYIPSYGTHIFEVRAIDAAGNTGDPAHFVWEYSSWMPIIDGISNFVGTIVRWTTELIRRIFPV